MELAKEFTKGELNNNIMMRHDLVAGFVVKNKYKRIAEVGVKVGENAYAIIRRCADTGYRLEKFYLVDPDVPSCAIPFDDNPEVERIVKISTEASKDVPDNSLDLVYIDANHEYEFVMDDIKYWLPKIKKGGIICGHDYDIDSRDGVRKAVEDSFDRYNLQSEVGTYNWWKYVE